MQAHGASVPEQNARGLLPVIDYANTAITVEYGNDLAGWTAAVHDGEDVIIDVTEGSPTDLVEVKLKSSTLADGGSLFVRLKVVVTP